MKVHYIFHIVHLLGFSDKNICACVCMCQAGCVRTFSPSIPFHLSACTANCGFTGEITWLLALLAVYLGGSEAGSGAWVAVV